MVRLIGIFVTVMLVSLTSRAEERLSRDFELNLNSELKIQLKELSFGELLYDYYQENYFAALTRMDVAQFKGEIVEHQQQLQLIRGVMYLSYGMLQSAESLFTQLLTEEQSSSQLAQVRFYLAKTNYLNGIFDKAQNHLKLAIDYLPSDLKDESLLILAQIAFNQGNLVNARELLLKISEHSEAGKYAQFNLAIFLLQKNEVSAAENIFDQLYPNEKSSQVEHALFDKAHLALGYYFLENKEIETARDYLLKIRLRGPFSERAILALGWAYYESGMQNKAIAHWQELLTRDARDPAVQEAAMALAFAYYKNGAKREALESFVTAAALYGEQLTLISNAKLNLKDALFQKWLDARGIFGDKVFERWAVGDVPVTDLPVEYYLMEVAATNEFNQHFHRFQEMSHLNDVLTKWERQIPVYQEMLSNHQERYQNIKPKVAIRVQQVFQQEFATNFKHWKGIAEQQLENDDLFVLANSEELEIYHDLMRLKTDLDNLPNDGFDVENKREKWRRIYGALLWKMAESYGPKRHYLQRQIDQTEEALDQLMRQKVSIENAEHTAGSRFINYDQRIFAIAQRIKEIKNSIQLTRELSRKAMEAILNEKLDKRKQELDFLLAQTELSIAKIQDEALSRILESHQ